MEYHVEFGKYRIKSNLLNNKKVVVFGFGQTGKQVVDFLIKRGYEIIEIWDNYNTNLTYQNIKICKPHENMKKDTVIIVSVVLNGVFEQLYSQTKKLGYCNILHYYEVLCDEILSYDEYRTFIHEIQRLRLEAYKNKTNNNCFILSSLEVPITEKCSLKCKECCNLMQYFENPQELNLNETLDDIRKVLETVDYISDFRILGGEPFMSKNLHIYIKFLSNFSNIGMISIYTNGTIIPVNENFECLKNDKVFLRISNYGEVSKNLQKLEYLCRENRIIYEIIPFSLWNRCAEFEKQSRTIDENKAILNQCCAKTLLSLRNHKIFRCPFLASAWSLHAIPQNIIEYVDINDKSIFELKNNIKEYLNNDYLKACEYCIGRPVDAEGDIPAAEQISTPRGYKKYEFSS